MHGLTGGDAYHLAEQAGSIRVLGRHVLATTLADLARWQQRYPQQRLAASQRLARGRALRRAGAAAPQRVEPHWLEQPSLR